MNRNVYPLLRRLSAVPNVMVVHGRELPRMLFGVRAINSRKLYCGGLVAVTRRISTSVDKSVQDEELFVRRAVFRPAPIAKDELDSMLQSNSDRISECFVLAYRACPAMFDSMFENMVADVLARVSYNKTIISGQSRKEGSITESDVVCAILPFVFSDDPEEKVRVIESLDVARNVKVSFCREIYTFLLSHLDNVSRFVRAQSNYSRLGLSRLLAYHTDYMVRIDSGVDWSYVDDFLHEFGGVLETVNKIVVTYSRMSAGISASISSQRDMRPDQIQDGVIGLFDAAVRFDVGAGGFALYAKRWVRQSVLNGIKDGSNAVSVPNGTWAVWRRLRKAQHDPAYVTDAELDELGIDSKTYCETVGRVKMANPLSLQYRYGDDDSSGTTDLQNSLATSGFESETPGFTVGGVWVASDFVEETFDRASADDDVVVFFHAVGISRKKPVSQKSFSAARRESLEQCVLDGLSTGEIRIS